MQLILATILQIPSAVAAKRVGNILDVTIRQTVKRPYTPTVTIIKKTGIHTSSFPFSQQSISIPPIRLTYENANMLNFYDKIVKTRPAAMLEARVAS